MLRSLHLAALASALTAFLLAGPAPGAGFYEGLAAYERGDYAAARAAWLPLAEAGDSGAQANLGVLYWRGQGVEQDHGEAARWFRLAAEQGNPEAQDNLGQLYYLGQGVEQDYAEAARWIDRAARQGDPNAQLRLGSLYASGVGLTRDESQAALWWRKAAEQGEATAQLRLAVAYEKGFGVPGDLEQALHWAERAAQQGDERAVDYVKSLEARAADAPPPEPGGVRIQVASVSGGESAARSEWQRLLARHPDLLGDLELQVIRVELPGQGVFHRVQAGRLPDREAARARCAALEGRGQACLVPPR